MPSRPSSRLLAHLAAAIVAALALTAALLAPPAGRPAHAQGAATEPALRRFATLAAWPLPWAMEPPLQQQALPFAVYVPAAARPLSGLPPAPVPSPTPTALPNNADTIRVSVDSDGKEGNGSSIMPAISGDGRYVAFTSEAANLVGGDTNEYMDVFVHDRQTGATTRVSVASDGGQADGPSLYPAISADGRYVAFASVAESLVGADAYGIVIHDRVTGETSSITGDGWDYGMFGLPSISGDGRYVAFMYQQVDLEREQPLGNIGVYVHDCRTGEAALISAAPGGTAADGHAAFPSLSADGRYVVFYSDATNLVEGDGNETGDVFVHDRRTGLTSRVSVAVDGGDADGPSMPVASISARGRYVVFTSMARNLVSDTPAGPGIYLRDLLTGQTTPVPAPAGDYDMSWHAAISPDGRYIAFLSTTVPPPPADPDEEGAPLIWGIHIHDRLTGETQAVKPAALSTEWGWVVLGLSAGGRYVVFASEFSDLVSDDTNDTVDVFVYDRGLAF